MSVQLNNGRAIPVVAFGTGTAWWGRRGIDEELVEGICERRVPASWHSVTPGTVKALNAGFKHLDLAEGYGNEVSVGEALKRWGGDRNSLWITEKILERIDDVPGALRSQLSELGTEYVDLYIFHAPDKIWKSGAPSLSEAWASMEKLMHEGLVKSIGVSNFRVEDLERLAQISKIKPAVNQIEVHPYVYEEAKGIIDYCRQHDIKVAAYSPSAPIAYFKGGPVDKVLGSIVLALAERAGTLVSPNQVLLKWALQVADIAVTTSKNEQRMKELVSVAELPDLTNDEMEAITEAGLKGGVQRRWMRNVFS